MLKYILHIIFFVTLAQSALAQGQRQIPSKPYPIETCDEPVTNDKPDAAEWQVLSNGIHMTWASRDVHYAKHRVPQVAEQSRAAIRAWRGERANIEALLYSKTNIGPVKLYMTAWQKDGKCTDITSATARPLRYVITDDYKSCGDHDMSLKPWLVADAIENNSDLCINAMETRPVWCSIEVPRDAEAGKYTTRLEAHDTEGKVVASISLDINVLNRTLPSPQDQKFHLDLWQQPYAVSRYYGVERWSEAHIEAMRPYLAALGRAGQKVVSTIMFYEPWGNQSHDKFSPMITTTLKADGTWTYDYTIFDRYVELCAGYGINAQINCYSMVPWDMTFRYFDEASGKDIDLKTTTSSQEYKVLWTNFLSAFREHLKQKGWFEKTCIAMDERSEEDMLNAYAIAHEAGFKMALAGNYHSSLTDKLQDFCVALEQAGDFSPEERQYRQDHNLTTTIYTSCADVAPNIYSCSLPAEAAFLPLYVAAHGLNGYLHWSWINWDEHPLTDSRYRLFGSGDTYSYYPGNRSSVRFERLIEGIQQYEKIQILRAEWHDNPQRLATLDSLLARCKCYAKSENTFATLVDSIEQYLNAIDAVTEAQMRLTIFSTKAGNIDTPPYRIPGISGGKDGRLIATAARLVCGTDPGFGQVDVVCRISKDNGKTWSREKEVAIGTGRTSATVNYFDTAFGDPAIVCDRESDEVLVMAVAGCTVYGHSSTNRRNPNLIAAIRSYDGGETWDKAENQTEAIYSLFDKGKAIDAAFVASGRIFQSRVVKTDRYYRLYAALTARPGGNRIIYSDDFGRTWQVLGGNSTLPIPDGDEAKCEELPDGRVIVSSRTSGGRLLNLYTYTNITRGKGKWQQATHCDFATTGRTPSKSPTNGEIIIVPVKRVADGKVVSLALQSIPMGNGRSDVGIYYGEITDTRDIKTPADLCKVWLGYYQVSHTSSAYSSMTTLSDGRIGLLYEESLTKWGKKSNPHSTTFHTAEGTHNVDGFELIYLLLNLETITSGKYVKEGS